MQQLRQPADLQRLFRLRHVSPPKGIKKVLPFGEGLKTSKSTVLFAARRNNLGQRENTQQIVIGADFLSADGAAGAGAGRQSEQYSKNS